MDSLSLIENFFEEPNKKNNYKTVKRGKKQKRSIQERRESTNFTESNLALKLVKPITKTQNEVFELFNNSENGISLHGTAGTGKTFLSLYLGIKEVIENNYKKLIIVRSALPSRDIGFLPGSEKDKLAVYERPYIAIFEELFGRRDAYDMFKRKGMVEFESTSFLRGLTFNDSLIILDESQNLTWAEASTLMTRIGRNSRLIICGDYRQSDHTHSRDKDGIHKLNRVLKKMNCVDFIEFKQKDIVRSDFVKSFIISCEEEENT